MHALFDQVLLQKNLSKAGDLFTLDDSVVVSDFGAILDTIQRLITRPDFLINHNEQSLVEIVITRLTSAIRETRSIEHHAPGLVALLETCLSYNLRPSGSHGLDPPHAKIASDVMACIFFNYSKKAVMRLAVPVSVKFLHKGNQDLSRNMSSYLSLAAIENAELLAKHFQPIIDSVISGNYSLARVLPTLYSVNRDPINSHVMTLVSVLHNCKDNTEKNALLSLFGLIAKDNPGLLEPSLPQLCESLNHPSTALATLQVFQNIAASRPLLLTDHMREVKLTAENYPKTTMTAIHVMGAIAKVKKDKSEETVSFILESLGRLEKEKHSLVLKEVIALTARYPSLLTAQVLNKVCSLEEGATSTTRNLINELRNEYNFRSNEHVMESIRSSSSSASREKLMANVGSGVTVLKVGGSKPDLSNSNMPSLGYPVTSTKHLYTQHHQSQPMQVDAKIGISSSGSKGKLDKSRDRLNAAHRSMTRLGGSQQTFDSKLGLYKSLTRLNSSQHNMSVANVGTGAGTSGPPGAISRFNSSSQVPAQPSQLTTPSNNITSVNVKQTQPHGFGAQVARSATCIPSSASTSAIGPVSTHRLSLAPISSQQQNLANSANQPAQQQVPFGGHRSFGTRAGPGQGPGASSPTKSMSSGSMTGCLTSEGGRDVLTVSVNQINQDLIRQVNTVLSQQPPIGSSVAPDPVNQGQRRAPSHSSGLLYPSQGQSQSQPPSLGLPLHAQVAPVTTKRTHSQGVFSSSTLPSPRRRQLQQQQQQQRGNRDASVESLSDDALFRRQQKSDAYSSENQERTKANRMSVFEPYPMRDTVQHFCEKHLDKIKSYMTSLMVKLPLPVKCTIEERKGRKHAKLHFACQGREGDHCLYKSTFYTMKTRNPRTWIHLMFLALQSRASAAISTRESSVSALKNCWEILKCENISFVTLVTGAFPPAKDQDALMHELRSNRFFDVFEYNGPEQHWGCFLCNHPERAMDFIQDHEPVIEGQLKEKKGGKWKLFKKWKSRYFTLSGAKLTYKETNGDSSVTQSLDVGSIRSVKVSREGRRNIPKAFEIFTHDRTFILKAKDGSNAQEWVQCLSVAKAHVQAQDMTLKKLAYGGSLGRLHPHGHHRPRLSHYSAASVYQRPTSLANSNITLRTAV